MIVADTNLLAYLLIEGEHTEQAESIFNTDPEWVAPHLWRSEFRNVLASYMRRNYITLEEAKEIMQTAEDLMRGKEHEVYSNQVLDRVQASSCSAYDCEFVALADQLGIKLITSDTKILANFSSTAVPLAKI